MKKALLILVVIVMVFLVLAPTAVGASDKSDHKIKAKYDGVGTLISVYPWDGKYDAWEYNFHIKEAVDGEYSVGSIWFKSASGDKVTGRVTRTDSFSWSDLTVYGVAKYNGNEYAFMLMFRTSTTPALFLSLSDSGNPWGDRDYNLHSRVPEPGLNVDIKEIR